MTNQSGKPSTGHRDDKDGGIVRIDGRSFVLVPAEEYAALLREADGGGFSQEEDAEDRSALAANDAARAAGEMVLVPREVTMAIVRGETPIAAFRKWRGLTQKQLAASAGLAQGHFSTIETGGRPVSVDRLRAIAKALQVPVSLLIDD